MTGKNIYFKHHEISNDMSSSGAKAALEGYRKQALYTLACILHPDGQDLVFRPEDTEDLAVYHGQRRLRVVQVKAYTDASFRMTRRKRSLPLILTYAIDGQRN
ncbi:MAG: hypothetical protein V1844_18210 [Pseudomonadota bacterium]